MCLLRAVMGPQYANRLGDLLEDVSNGNQVVATEASHIMEDSTKPRRTCTVCAWVNVIYGCNERCTYCIVSTTRGVEQSRPVLSSGAIHTSNELQPKIAYFLGIIMQFATV